jgi:hypothetical protein
VLAEAAAFRRCAAAVGTAVVASSRGTLVEPAKAGEARRLTVVESVGGSLVEALA